MHCGSEFLSDFKKLIAVPSVSSIDPQLDQSNKAMVELLANWLSDRGFRIELMPVSNNPDKYNLVAILGEGENGLVLSGHTDTVPYNKSAWQQDPFILTERENRLYGLGASDMKCFFALIMESMRQLNTGKLTRPLTILATADEESSMAGARVLAESGRNLGKFALIGEPTGLKPVTMHKGVLMESIRLTGTSGHSSDPSFGNSALEGMHAIIDTLMHWRDELQSRYRNKDFRVPEPTLNFGSIHGGDNPNRICAECVLTIDIRLLPEMSLETTRNELRKKIETTIEGSGLQLECRSLFSGVPAMHTQENSEIVRLAEKLTGFTAGSVAFGTEGPFLNSMGLETVILGPGDIDQAHQANEYVCMERLAPMMNILNKLIAHFCLGATVHVN